METVAVRDDARNNWLERFITRTTAIPLPRNLRSKGLRTIVTLVSVTFSLLYIYYARVRIFLTRELHLRISGVHLRSGFHPFPRLGKISTRPNYRVRWNFGIEHHRGHIPLQCLLPHSLHRAIRRGAPARCDFRHHGHRIGPGGLPPHTGSALPLISLLLIGYALFGPYFLVI